MLGLTLLMTAVAGVWWARPAWFLPGTQALVISHGDPHLRALMRTISASEANVRRPYHVLHGGGAAQQLDMHPNRCVGIRRGPNKGNCSTAAGRYQLLNATWQGLASRYHPQDRPVTGVPFVPSFEPEFQDAVVLAWLSDPKAWGMDIAGALREGQITSVLRRLSGTWTSLGYGIENNVMSAELPRIYQHLLAQELARARQLHAFAGQYTQKPASAER